MDKKEKGAVMARLSGMMHSTVLLVICLAAPRGGAPGLAQPSSAPAQGTTMLTIFLRHDQSKTLDEIQAHLKQTGFDKNFPPAGTEVVSWYVMMGIGQVVTLRFPAEKLREVNLAIEHGAWGAYHTEFYATYDYRAVWEGERERHR
jgi:hypothetical protein